MKITDIANAKVEHALEITENDFIGGSMLFHVTHAHFVLFGFVAREYDDFARFSNFADQQASYETFSREPVPPVTRMVLSASFFYPSSFS
jgi:hypothetical protein